MLGLLHVESTAVIAVASYFIAGLSSLALFRVGRPLRNVLLLQEAALIVPGFLLTITTIWRPNCGYFQGLLFFLLFPVITVVFATGCAYVVHAVNGRATKSILIAAGILICLSGPIYDIGLHPQFYTYNHVFGGVLGPVYDEELAIRRGLIVFRGLTLAWTALLVFVAGVIIDRRSTVGSRRVRWRYAGIGLTTSLVVLCYVYAAPLGINTTVQHIRGQLTGHVATEHFDIYFAPEWLSEEQASYIAHEHEYRYYVLAGKLDLRVEDRIQSFLYPDPDTKAELTGARHSNVAPIWLAGPQMHVLVTEMDRVFPHELAHVFSREFGLPWIRASVSIGLLEGLAVALQPPDGRPDAHDQVSAAIMSAPSAGISLDVAAHLSPWGFWTGRGAVSYTTMGSFVAYLLETYGPNPLKEAYAWADFESAYGKSVERLTLEWMEKLSALQAVQASSGPLVSARFAVPSLFEKTCPHYIPPYRREYGLARTALMKDDSSTAFRHLSRSIDLEPRYYQSLDLWARLALARQGEDEVLARISRVATDSMTAGLLVRLGDALALVGDSTQARHAYGEATRRLPTYAHEDRSRIALRILTAGSSGVIRMLTTANEHSHQGIEPISTWARALVLARQDRYELAADLLRTTGRMSNSLAELPSSSGSVSRVGPGPVRELYRRRLVWLARFTYRSGEPSAAAALAEDAATSYRRAGAVHEAAAIDDFREKMLWLASRESAHAAHSSTL